MRGRSGKQHHDGLRKLRVMTLLPMRLMKYISFYRLPLGVPIYKFSIHASHFWRWPPFCQTTGFQAARLTWHFQQLQFVSFRSVASKRNVSISSVLPYSQNSWLCHHSFITRNRCRAHFHCMFIICRLHKIFNVLVPILSGISQMVRFLARLSLLHTLPLVTGLQSLSLPRGLWSGQTL
jgi:hypothetical protein